MLKPIRNNRSNYKWRLWNCPYTLPPPRDEQLGYCSLDWFQIILFRNILQYFYDQYYFWTRVAIQWSLFTVYPQAKPVRVPSQNIHSLASRFGSSFYQRDKNSYSSWVKNQLITRNKPYDGSSCFPALQLNFWSRWITHSRFADSKTNKTDFWNVFLGQCNSNYIFYLI